MSKIIVIMFSLFSFTSLAFSSPIEVKCDLERDLDEFLDMPKKFSIFKESDQVYVYDSEGKRNDCEVSPLAKIYYLFCGDRSDGLYLIANGQKMIMTDAQSFTVLATYKCK